MIAVMGYVFQGRSQFKNNAGDLMPSESTKMQSLEADYQQASGLANRARYKIFYGMLRPAPCLVLGLNPGGDPEQTSADGTRGANNSVASSSGAWFEQDEHDLLDCQWPENTGLKRLLLPLFGGDEKRIRREVVKTNLAFRRSREARDINIDQAIEEARPFVDRILAIVDPKLVILAGVSLSRFLDHHVQTSKPAATLLRDASIGHVVFNAAWVTFEADLSPRLVVQVGHASQFSWTYAKHDIPGRISSLLAFGHDSAILGDVMRSPDHHVNVEAPLKSSVNKPQSVPRSIGDVGDRHPQLHELADSWRRLGIERQFVKVHHFSSPSFATKASSLNAFVKWCSDRDIRDENYRTLLRGLDVARRVKLGVDIAVAITQSWESYPLVSR